jgi:hypothetical protein
MATTADAFYRTEVFALRDQRATISATGRQWADVFSRQGRHETVATMPRQHRITFRLPIEGDSIDLAYSSLDPCLPQWAGAVLQSLSERWGVQPGWDSYSAAPTSPQLAVKLLNVLSGLLVEDSMAPQITPLADGGVQAEWHQPEQDLEIVVPAIEDPTYYYFNGRTSEEEEGGLDPNWAHVQDLINRLG